MNSSISARHSAELEHVFESLSLGSNDVENWRGNGWQRFPHHNPQWVWHQGVWDDNDKTSHHLMREKWISIIQVSIQVDLKEPGQKVDLGGKCVALQSSCALTLTYSCKITKQKSEKCFWSKQPSTKSIKRAAVRVWWRCGKEFTSFFIHTNFWQKNNAYILQAQKITILNTKFPSMLFLVCFLRILSTY